LPKLPYQGGATQREVVAFGGLNRTENYKEGELTDAAGIVTAHYPVITQREAREAVTGYTDPADMYSWDGHLIIVQSDGTMLLDGSVIGQLEASYAGKRQFCAVNSRMCIWPDKMMIDMDQKNLEPMVTEAVTPVPVPPAASSVKLEENGIMVSNLKEASRVAGSDLRAYDVDCWTYTYGKDTKAVADCWDDDTGWDLEALGKLERKKTFTYSSRRIEQGDIFIPSYDGNAYDYLYAYDYGTIDRDDYNTDGCFGVFLGTGHYRVNYFDVYDSDSRANLFPGLFEVGDVVSISGTAFAIGDKDSVVITEINSEENAIYWGESDAIAVPMRYGECSSAVGADAIVNLNYYDYDNEDYINARFTADVAIDAGMILFYSNQRNGEPVYVWDPIQKKVIATYQQDTSLSGGISIPSIEYDAGAPGPVVIRRSVPDLDYICGHENRLWGVSNDAKGRTIFASALGKPWAFGTFDGVDTDAWQVAVGSAGDFTAICAFNGGVCCWKEDRLHKILGSYPSEYYMNEYRLEGVGAGNWRSLAVINETLYYSGRHGVYSFNGGIPSFIGYELDTYLHDAAGGTDGRDYVLSGTNKDGETELLVFDTVHRLWMKEDALNVTSFSWADGALHMLTGGSILKAGQGADDDVLWHAEFCPFDEVSTVHKYHLRLVLRLDRTAGSTFKAEFSTDGAGWRTAYEGTAAGHELRTVELPITRCDSFRVRLSGTGCTTVRAMTREFLPGSERRH